MKRILPKFKEEPVLHRPFYGSQGVTDRSGCYLKTNMICNNPNCKYHSRRWITQNSFISNKKGQKNSISSVLCPIHRTELINIGFASKMPKNPKERKLLIELYSPKS